MLPVVSEDTRSQLLALANSPQLKDWQRDMIHHLKEDNPEVNTLLLELAQESADPKRVVLAGYLVYKLLELAAEDEDSTLKL